MNARDFVTKLSYKVDESGRRQYDRGMQAVRQTVQRARDQAVKSFASMGKSFSSTAGNISRRWDSAMSAVKRASGAMASKIKADMASAGKSGNAVAGQIKQLAAAYAGFHTAKSMGGFIFGAASEYETAVTQLTTLVGKDKAPEVFRGIADFAKKTPYELKDVVQMVARLEGAGFGAIGKDGKLNQNMMYKLGDLAAASNKPLAELTDTILSANRGLASMIDNFVGLAGKSEDGQLAVEMFDRVTQKTIKKTIAEGDKAGLMEFFMQAGTRGGISGGMIALSKTLEGQKSTLVDAAKGLAVSFYKGFSDHVHEQLSVSTAFLEEMEPKITAAGQKVGQILSDIFLRWLPKALDLMRTLAPMAAGGVALLTFRWIGLKAIMAGGWIIKAIQWVRALTWSTVALNAAAFAIPIAIGALIAGLIYLGYEVYRYFTQGKGLIADLTKRFPELKKAIDGYAERLKAIWITMKPVLQHIWDTLWEIGQIVMPLLVKAADWLFSEVFIPLLIKALNWLSQFLDDLVRGYEIVVPALTQALETTKSVISGIVDDFLYWKDNAWNTINLIKEWLQPLIDMFGGLRDAVNSVWGGGPNAATGADLLNDPNFPFNSKAAAQLVKNASSVYSGARRCLNGVWQAYVKTFGANGAAPVAHDSAYQAADTLAKDPRFKEIRVTPEMLNDPNFVAMLHGATAVYNRSSGFSTEHGHIEVWDMLRHKALYGNGAASLNRNAHMLANARVFIPVQNTGSVPMGGSGAGGAGVTVNNNIQQNFGPAAATPAKVKQASADGVNKGLSNAAKNTPKLTS